MEIAVVLNVLFASVSVGFSADNCNRDTGPAGSPECVLLQPKYGKHQWATCLTDKYIQTYSKGDHQCVDRTRTYCWYQCMVEIHSIDSGPVYDDLWARCSYWWNYTTDSRNACYSRVVLQSFWRRMQLVQRMPRGKVPSFWEVSFESYQCSNQLQIPPFKKRYPCRETGDSYALDYAEKFCNLYKQHYSEFDTTGQQCIDTVRKCLQVNLVPILRPFVKKTCEELKQMAFESHPGCYLNPDEGKPSICELGCQNWARVFWTVKSAFIQAPVSTFKQMIEVKANCSRHC